MDANRSMRRGTVLLPGLAALATYGAMQLAGHVYGRAAAAIDVDPYPHAWHGYEMYPPALTIVALVAAGAVGAALSRRAGGTARHRVVAGMFPVLMIGAIAAATLTSEVSAGWIAIAALAGFVGAAPFVARGTSRSSSAVR